VPAGIGESSLAPLDRRQPVVGLRQAGVQLDGALELFPRVFQPLEAGKAPSEQPVGLGRPRGNPGCVLKDPVGLEHPITRAEQVGHLDQRRQVVAVETRGGAKLDERLLGPPRAPMLHAGGVMGLGGVGSGLGGPKGSGDSGRGAGDQGGSQKPRHEPPSGEVHGAAWRPFSSETTTR
jgi:hypothetical protein